MGKEAVTYIQFVTKFLNEEKKKAGFESKKAMGEAAKAWKEVKAGKHEKFEAASGVPKPGHKHAPSKTRKGRQDYVTHKGSKFYNRKGHRQDDNESGVVGKPYESGLDVDALDLCPECKDKVKSAMGASAGTSAGTGAGTSMGKGRGKKGGCGCAMAGGRKSRRRGRKSRRGGKTRRGRK